MNTILYKLLGALAVSAVVLGVGWHLGGLSSAKQLSDYKAAYSKSSAIATKAASDAQAKADVDHAAQLEAELQDARQALTVAQANDTERKHTIATLKQRIRTNAKTKPEIDWLNTAIPAGLLDGLCFYTDSRTPPDCKSDSGSVRPDPGSVP